MNIIFQGIMVIIIGSLIGFIFQNIDTINTIPHINKILIGVCLIMLILGGYNLYQWWISPCKSGFTFGCIINTTAFGNYTPVIFNEVIK